VANITTAETQRRRDDQESQQKREVSIYAMHMYLRGRNLHGYAYPLIAAKKI
jgi:hypothetical protein